jgi:hypothetical protein
MSIRLVAAAKGLAVGVLSLAISVAGAYAYATWRSSACPFEEGGIAQHPGCNQELAAFGVWFEVAGVLFFLLLALGPLLAWVFRLPLPGRYVIPPVLTAVVDALVLCSGLPSTIHPLVRRVTDFLLVAPLLAYPVIAARNAGRRREASAAAPSMGATPSAYDQPEP